MKVATRSFYVVAVQRTLDALAARLDDAVSLTELADQAALSPFHFHRVFRGMVGETPLGLLRRLRLERAAWQLATTARAVVAIAFDAGFETHEAFSRAFRDAYGSSPSGFRDRRTRRVDLASPSGVHYSPTGQAPGFIPRDSGGTAMLVDVVSQPAQRVAALSHHGPYNQIGEAFARLGEVAGSAGWLARPGFAMVAVYYDDPESVAPDELRSDAGLVVPAGIALPSPLVERMLPAGRYARTEHAGSYAGLGDTWARFMGEWLPASGHRIRAGVSYECYKNTPMDTPPEALRTELYVPIE
jgi:AraC family transcriptional regulator